MGAGLLAAGLRLGAAEPNLSADQAGATEVTVLPVEHKVVPGRSFFIGELNLEMRFIPAGTFLMGSPADEPGHFNNEGQHQVKISRPFWLGRTPVTHGQWKALMGTDIAHQVALMFPGDPDPQRYLGNSDDDVAMYYVSWEEAMAFCQKLNGHARAAGLLPDGYEYSLPTEAQWEYACRAGTTAATYAGPIQIVGNYNAPVLDAIAWYGGNSAVGYQGRGWSMGRLAGRQHGGDCAGPRAAGMKLPNAWGLYDMLGNVWQWCRDWYGPYQISDGVTVDPTGPDDGTIHVHRGGSWYSFAASCRSAARSRNVPGERFYNLGFRIALAPVIAP